MSVVAYVFGKKGCAKCAMLNRRLDELLAKPEYQSVRKEYRDVLTEDGLVQFCLAQCLNPSRIPALVMAEEAENGDTHYIERKNPDAEDPVCKTSRLHQYIGIQTDYGPVGKGVITPEMIETVVKEAMNA